MANTLSDEIEPSESGQTPQSKYLFMCCQVGAEAACKMQFESRWPEAKLAFSRPGFITYKVASNFNPSGDLQNTFARTYGFGLGKHQGTTQDATRALFEVAREVRPDHVHIWERDKKPVGQGFEPFPSDQVQEFAGALEKLRSDKSQSNSESSGSWSLNQAAAPNQSVLDCILIDDGLWWFGQHTAHTTFQAWPGGVPDLVPNASSISRAYYKMLEALMWSRLPFRSGDLCAEIGSAPGGATQALLECGLHVVGVDPAEMDPKVAQHKNFRHVRKRGRDVRRREFRDIRWLFSDSNVAPVQTLDTLEDIVTHESVRVRGMLITLKMPQWEGINELGEMLSRIRGWGYKYVKPRHLAFNRQEICIAAFKNRGMLRAR